MYQLTEYRLLVRLIIELHASNFTHYFNYVYSISARKRKRHVILQFDREFPYAFRAVITVHLLPIQ